MYGFVRAEHLNIWASRYTAPAEFPRLMRLLVWALVRAPRSVNFPADEAVRLAGYDGVVDINESIGGIPSGSSVWELGTNKDVKAKADEDYEKRSVDPVGVDPASTSFVFVTPRTWPGKAKWASAKNREKRWKEVLAFDAEDLVQWMEVSPPVAVWFGQMAALTPKGVRSLQGSLDDYRLATQPEFDPAGTLLGRQAQVDIVTRTLLADPETIELETMSQEEGEAFIGSCIAALPFDQQESVWARCLCVDDQDALRHVAATGERYVLLMDGPSTTLPANAHLHTIIRTLRPGSGSPKAIALPSPNMRQLIDWVEKQGVERNDAFQRCYDADASLERVRRMFLRSGPPIPDWSVPGVASTVAAVILVGTWDGGNEADQVIVSAIAGCDYARFEGAVGSWTLGANPLMTRAGIEWRVHSRQEAWRRLEPYLRTESLEAMIASSEKVLLEPDMRFELPADERWLARMHGKRRSHSEALRKGIADGILILATRGDDRQPCYSGVRATDWADRTARGVFEHSAEPDFWRRVRGELTELAEASPERFLAALEQDLRTEQPQILDLFESEGEHGGCLHADLLWALESLGWAPAYVGRVARILAGLAEVDPGGRWSNRPAASLAAMLNPIQPQCGAAAADRHALLAQLAKERPAVTAKLCETLFSRDGGVIHMSHRPSMREWAPKDRLQKVMVADYWVDVQVAARQLLGLAGVDALRWMALLGHLKQLTPDVSELVLKGINDAIEAFPASQRLKLRDGLRKLLHHHNQFVYSDKEIGWLYTEATLERLKRLYEALMPIDPVEAHAWLFAFWPERPFDTGTDWKLELEALEQDRLNAAEILSQLGLEHLLERLGEFESRRALGISLARTTLGNEFAVDLFQRHGESAQPAVQELIQGFASHLSQSGYDAFVNKWIDASSKDQLPELTCATLLLGLPSAPPTWDIAAKRGPSCEDAYWKQANIGPLDRPQDAERAARSLIEANRILDAIDALAMSVKTEWLAKDGDCDLIIEVLRRGVIASNENPTHGQRVSYDVTTLLKRLSKSGRVSDSDMSGLEWAYFGLLEHQAQHELVIHRRLISEPSMVIDLMSLIYHADGVDKVSLPVPTEEQKRMASNAWHVLNDWHPFKRLAPDEMPSAESLNKFADDFLRIATERGYLAIALDHLGKALASSPPEADGIWPHESIRELLERMDAHDELKDAFIAGRFTDRGVTTRSIGDGGAQERQLAQEYRRWQNALSIRWPVTSGLLGRIAVDFDRDAVRMDVDDRQHH